MITVEFEFEKSTLNTVRFQESGATAENGTAIHGLVVGSLYIQKWAVKELENPENLMVTITKWDSS